MGLSLTWILHHDKRSDGSMIAVIYGGGFIWKTIPPFLDVGAFKHSSSPGIGIQIYDIGVM